MEPWPAAATGAGPARLGAEMNTARNAGDAVVIPGYTNLMKTAISVPDETFDRVTRRAAALGMSRSEFFARAAQRYLDDLDTESLTKQIDSALEVIDGPDETQGAAVTVGRRVVGAVDDDW